MRGKGGCRCVRPKRDGAGCRFRWEVAALLLVVVTGATGALAAAPAGTDSLAADLFEQYRWEDPLETARLLAEIQEGGLPLTTADWERLGLSPSLMTGELPEISAIEAGWSGQVTWQGRSPQVGIGSRITRLRCRWRQVAGALRWRVGADGEQELGGTVEARQGVWKAAGGGVGLHHGLGLFCAGPGRWRSLSAAMPLLSGGQGGKGFAGAADRCAVWGLLTEVNAGPGRLACLVGRNQDPPRSRPRSEVRLLRAAAGRDRGVELSCLAGRQGGDTGASLAVAAQPAWGAVRAEAAFWLPDGDQSPARAWAAAGCLRDDRWRLEAQLAVAERQAVLLARRPACLGSWNGWGWAVRGYLRFGDRTRVLGLWARNRGRQNDTAGPETETTVIWELGGEWRPTPGIRCEVRHRASQDVDRGWADRLPWLPALQLASRLRSQTVILVRGGSRDLDWRAEIRMLAQRRDPAPAGTVAQTERRSLLAWRGVWLWRPGWRLRAGWAWAWGEGIDLVSVANPLAGVVLPRHWGSWSGEVSGGIEKQAGPLACQFGLVVRNPARQDSRPPSLEWLGGVRWSW